MIINDISNKAKQASKSTKKLFSKLKRTKPSNLDDVVSKLNEEAFRSIDCLECANCCKTTSPIITSKDIKGLSKYLKVRDNIFIETYLKLDEEGDYIFTGAPCPFLQEDNFCSVYENRPKACREYPHLNRKRFYQILDITYNNSYICPAVYQTNEALKKLYR